MFKMLTQYVTRCSLYGTGTQHIAGRQTLRFKSLLPQIPSRIKIQTELVHSILLSVAYDIDFFEKEVSDVNSVELKTRLI